MSLIMGYVKGVPFNANLALVETKQIVYVLWSTTNPVHPHLIKQMNFKDRFAENHE